jgi:hypothetical protein
MDSGSAFHIELEPVERRLMVLALNEYSGLAHKGSELLPPVVGRSNARDWSTYYLDLLETIKIAGALTDLDWARALFLTEASFGSQLVGAGWEWDIGQDGVRDLMVLRSLQSKVGTDERSRLLQENVTFPAPITADVAAPVHTDGDSIELDDDERALMSRTIGAYMNSPRHGFAVLASLVGQPTYDSWLRYVAQLESAVAEEQDLVDLDWTRALLLTEMGFTSVLVGFGSQFTGADEHDLGVLRSLQLTLGSRDRRLRWIRSRDD